MKNQLGQFFTTNSDYILQGFEKFVESKEDVDINFMNFLSNINKDFYSFVKNSKEAIRNKKIIKDKFDKILT